MNPLIAGILTDIGAKALSATTDAISQGDPLGTTKNPDTIDPIIQTIKNAREKKPDTEGTEYDNLKSLFGDVSKLMASDEDLKNISKKWKSGGKIDEKDFNALRDLVPSRNGAHIDEADMWEDDVLDDYIEYIHNYEYNYKPEAVDVDPSIDPDQKHIGVMAQDVEKVNESAVTEDPSGYLKVDTGRLTLMDAGAIAGLGRRVNILLDRIEKLEAKVYGRGNS